MQRTSVEDKLKAIEMYESGCTLKEVAESYNTSIPLVHYWLKHKSRYVNKNINDNPLPGLQNINNMSHHKMTMHQPTGSFYNTPYNYQNNGPIANRGDLANYNARKDITSANISQGVPMATMNQSGNITNGMEYKNHTKVQSNQDQNKQALISEYKTLKHIYDQQILKADYIMKIESNSTNRAFNLEVENYNRIATSVKFHNIVERLEYLETILFSIN